MTDRLTMLFVCAAVVACAAATRPGGVFEPVHHGYDAGAATPVPDWRSETPFAVAAVETQRFGGEGNAPAVDQAIEQVRAWEPINSLQLDELGNLHIYHHHVEAVFAGTKPSPRVAKLLSARCKRSIQGWPPGGTVICLSDPGLAAEIYGTSGNATEGGY